jgi:hypothetical protein
MDLLDFLQQKKALAKFIVLIVVGFCLVMQTKMI